MRSFRNWREENGYGSAREIGFGAALALFLAVPVGLFAYGFVIAFTPETLPLWAGIGLGVVLGSAFVAFHILQQGNTLLEILVGWFIAMTLILILIPVGVRGREHRQARQRAAAQGARVPVQNTTDETDNAVSTDQ